MVQILESPTSYMMERCSQPQSGTHDSKNKPETAGPPEEPVDPAIVKSILQQLIPVFCNIFKVNKTSPVLLWLNCKFRTHWLLAYAALRSHLSASAS